MTYNPSHSYPYTYKMVVAYDGTNYVGWQIQPNGLTVQAELKRVINMVIQEDVNIVGSGRTDSGVHAIGQVAHFRCHKEIDLERTLRSANALLASDIRIKSITPAPRTFHALFSATGKIYHYHLWLDPINDPFLRKYHLHLLRKLDIDRLCAGAKVLVGTHDFSAFANEAAKGAAGRNPVRTLHRLDIVEQRGGIRLEFEGNGFLYKMVRNIVGTLVGGAIVDTKNPWFIDDLPEILTSKDRSRAGRAASPQGLFLMDVFYDNVDPT